MKEEEVEGVAAIVEAPPATMQPISLLLTHLESEPQAAIDLE
jgi:hypothetical protein